MYLLSSLQGAPWGSSIFRQWYLATLHNQKEGQKLSDMYDQYFHCRLHFSICSLCIYWVPSREIQEGALILGNGIMAPDIFRSCSKKISKSTIIICFVICILVCAPYLYIWLPLGSARRELHFWQQRVCLLTYPGAMTQIFWGLQSIFVLLFASGK